MYYAPTDVHDLPAYNVGEYTVLQA